MNKHLEKHRLFTPSGCLKLETITNYISGKTKIEDIRIIEIHLSDCPLCSDAVEGYMEIGKDTDINAILNEAKKNLITFPLTKEVNINSHQKSKTKQTNKFLYISIAASLALLVTAYIATRFIVNDTKKNEIIGFEDASKHGDETLVIEPSEDSPGFAEPGKKEKSTEEQPVNSDKSGYLFKNKSEKLSTSAGEETETTKEVRIETEDKYSGIVDDLFLALDENTENQQNEEERNQATQNNKNIAGSVNSVSDEVIEDVTVTTVMKSSTKTGERREDKRSNSITQSPSSGIYENSQDQDLERDNSQGIVNNGIDAYKKGDYPVASARFDEALTSDPDNYQALYYNGMSYYSTGQYEKALQSFNKLQKIKKNPYYQAAQWQIAIINIEKGDQKQARKVLNEVIDENGPYRSQAEEAIKNLDK